MKQSSRHIPGACSLFLLIFLPVIFYSCDSYNFLQPQPADKANIYEFPKEYRGQWKEIDDTFTETSAFTEPLKSLQGDRYMAADFNPPFPFNEKTYSIHGYGSSKEEAASYFIDKKYALFIISQEEKIVKGAWPKYSKQEGFIYPPYFYNSQQEIKYDSLHHPTDTINKYLLNRNLIYEIDNERFLEKGYSYTLDNDTMIVNKVDTICIDLGQNAMLRKLDNRFYVFNIRNVILGEDSYWWRVMLLEKTGNNSIAIWECTSKTGELPSLFYARPSKSDIFYFDSQWTTAEMLQLIKEGYFKVSAQLTRH